MTTLLHERGTLGFALAGDARGRRCASWSRCRSERGADDPTSATASRRSGSSSRRCKLTNYRALTTLMQTGIPGPEGSVSKLTGRSRTSG